MDHKMKITLKIWRQKNRTSPGKITEYQIDTVDEHMSFLEMLDVLNEQLLERGEDPVAFDHDCREGICGMCSLVINGIPHGHEAETTTCQLHMRRFKDGDVIYVEPWRARPFPVIKDLIVDRSALDRIIQAGGYISVNTGSALEANTIPVPKYLSDRAMDAAECIGCGACVAACKNASAMLFTAAKVSHLAILPHGHPEAKRRVQAMLAQMDAEGFGNCSNYYECEAACPKGISADFIAKMNRQYVNAVFTEPEAAVLQKK